MSDLVTLGIAWIIGAVVVFVVGAAVWFVRELRNAPTEVESTPLGDLLGGRTEYPESFVLHSGADDLGGQLCFDCGGEAEMHMPWAVSVQSSAVVLIEAALCFGCALVETSTETERAD